MALPCCAFPPNRTSGLRATFFLEAGASDPVESSRRHCGVARKGQPPEATKRLDCQERPKYFIQPATRAASWQMLIHQQKVLFLSDAGVNYTSTEHLSLRGEYTHSSVRSPRKHRQLLVCQGWLKALISLNFCVCLLHIAPQHKASNYKIARPKNFH